MCRHIATKVGINSASGFLKGHIYVYKNLYNGDFKETVLRIFHTAHHYKNAFVSHRYLDTIVSLLLRIVLGLVQTDGFIY